MQRSLAVTCYKRLQQTKAYSSCDSGIFIIMSGRAPMTEPASISRKYVRTTSFFTAREREKKRDHWRSATVASHLQPHCSIRSCLAGFVCATEMRLSNQYRPLKGILCQFCIRHAYIWQVAISCHVNVCSSDIPPCRLPPLQTYRLTNTMNERCTFHEIIVAWYKAYKKERERERGERGRKERESHERK